MDEKQILNPPKEVSYYFEVSEADRDEPYYVKITLETNTPPSQEKLMDIITHDGKFPVGWFRQLTEEEYNEENDEDDDNVTTV